MTTKFDANFFDNVLIDSPHLSVYKHFIYFNLFELSSSMATSEKELNALLFNMIVIEVLSRLAFVHVWP